MGKIMSCEENPPTKPKKGGIEVYLKGCSRKFKSPYIGLLIQRLWYSTNPLIKM